METESTEDKAVSLTMFFKFCGSKFNEIHMSVVNHGTAVTTEIIFRLHLSEEYFIKILEAPSGQRVSHWPLLSGL